MSTVRLAALAFAFLIVPSPLLSRQTGQPRPATIPAEDPVLALVGRGSQLYLAQNYKAAISPYQQALDLEKRKPSLSVTMFRILVDNLGIAYGLTGDLKHAEETFDYGISRDPAYPMFHYNQACTYAELDDLDRAIAQLGLAYKYKQNLIPGEEFPDPRTDDSFQRYLKNARFLGFLKSVEPGLVPEPWSPPGIRGTLLRPGRIPIAGAQVVLQMFNDEACAKLFDLPRTSPEDAARLAKCSRDLFTVETDENGKFAFAGVQAGWYAVRFLWTIEPKPSTGPSADHISGFLVVYAAQKDASGRYDTLSQGPAFHFTAERDYTIEFKY